MSQTIKEQAARVLGMKTREIVDVQDHGHYAVVTTHDGARSLVYEDGTVEPHTPQAEAALQSLQHVAAQADEQDADGEPDDGDEDEGAGADDGEVPSGTVEVVLAWVGQDADRAQRARDAELATERPRTGLVDKLQKVVDA